jgi:hypothetical protein
MSPSPLHAVDRMDNMVGHFMKDPVRAQARYAKKNPFHASGRVSEVGATSGYGYLTMENGSVVVYLTRPYTKLIRTGGRAQIIGRVRGWSPLLEAVIVDGYVRE